MNKALLIIAIILFVITLVYVGKSRSEMPIVVLPPQPLDTVR